MVLRGGTADLNMLEGCGPVLVLPWAWACSRADQGRTERPTAPLSWHSLGSMCVCSQVTSDLVSATAVQALGFLVTMEAAPLHVPVGCFWNKMDFTKQDVTHVVLGQGTGHLRRATLGWPSP